MRTAAFILMGLLFVVSGCQDAETAGKEGVLKAEKAQLEMQLRQCGTENEQLKKQIKIFARSKQGKRKNLYELRRIKLGNYTGFYDKDEDGKKEKLIVYIQPMDSDGDIIKAAGAVDVELWDLNKKSCEALLGQWQVKPEELRKLWFATLMTINYRLAFDVGDKIEGLGNPLTVKVSFVDHASGKVFQEQKAVNP